MAESKKYDFHEEKISLVKESASVVYMVAKHNSSIQEDNVLRDDFSRAITGDELLSRLRPRIKSLFR